MGCLNAKPKSHTKSRPQNKSNLLTAQNKQNIQKNNQKQRNKDQALLQKNQKQRKQDIIKLHQVQITKQFKQNQMQKHNQIVNSQKQAIESKQKKVLEQQNNSQVKVTQGSPVSKENQLFKVFRQNQNQETTKLSHQLININILQVKSDEESIENDKKDKKVRFLQEKIPSQVCTNFDFGYSVKIQIKYQ